MIADVIAHYPFDQTARISCPECTPERRKQRSKDMTLTRKPDGAIVYHCHHCGANGSVQPKKQEITLSAVPSKGITSNKLEERHYDWLASRGISKETADKMGLFAADRWFNRLDKKSDAIGFPYYRDGALIAAKAGEKRISYVIFNGRIASARMGWRWRKYSGSNPHNHHCHISFTKQGDADSSFFNIPLLGGK